MYRFQSPRWRRLFVGTDIIVIGLATGSAVYFLRVGAQSVRKPYLAHTLVQHIQPDGSFSNTVFITDATRSDGSWMTDTLVVQDAASARPMREICLTATKTITSYDPETNAANSAPISDLRYTSMISPISPDCLKAHPGPGSGTCVPTSQTVLGYPVWSLTREFSERGTNQIRVEELVAPSLEWKTLQFLSYKNGKLIEKRIVDAIAQGEPAPGLFTVPPDAVTVSTMSQFVKGFEERRGRALDPVFQRFLERRDNSRQQPR